MSDLARLRQLEALNRFALDACVAASEVELLSSGLDMLTSIGALSGAIAVVNGEGEVQVALTRGPDGALDVFEPDEVGLKQAIAGTAPPADVTIGGAPPLGTWFEMRHPAPVEGATWVSFGLGGFGATPDVLLCRFEALPELPGLFTLVHRHLVGALAVARARYDLERRVASRTEELAAANIELNKRLGELGQAQARLVDASRKAGMADVATNVLHNVGNVLNSVNVSADLVMQSLRGSKAAGLEKAVALWRAQPDPARFITENPRGAKLLDYFATLAEALRDERVRNQAELGSLVKNIDHIKAIVSLQQSFARSSGVTERLSLDALLDDAVKTNASSFGRHGIVVERDLQAAAEVEVDRHKLFQILMNLLSNASQAVKRLPAAPRIVLRTRDRADGQVVIEVEDNGVGIAPEVMPKVFTHGFTTRPEGHGFGLHSSACAAVEMGGSLHGHSDGTGKGAKFTVTVPRVPARRAAA